MKPNRIVVSIEIEADGMSTETWRYRIRVSSNRKSQTAGSGKASPERVMQLAQNALREARGE